VNLNYISFSNPNADPTHVNKNPKP